MNVVDRYNTSNIFVQPLSYVSKKKKGKSKSNSKRDIDEAGVQQVSDPENRIGVVR